MSAPPAWLADPTGRHQMRYWDGQQWTDYVRRGRAVDRSGGLAGYRSRRGEAIVDGQGDVGRKPGR